MNIFDEIKNLPILEVLTAFWHQWKKVGREHHLVRDWKIDSSFKISPQKNIAKDFWKSWIQGNPFDTIALLGGLDPKDNDTQKELIQAFVEYFPELAKYDKSNEDHKFEKSLKNDEILKKYKEWDFILWWFSQNLYQFFSNRWVDVKKDNLNIWKIVKTYWLYENYYCSETKSWKATNTKVVIFPMYDENFNIIWIKLRRTDTKKIRGIKSIWVWKIWLLYEKKTKDTTWPIYIVEWEVDYLIMRLLWYDNVIWNLWWVQSSRELIKEITYNNSQIISLYDNDNAWLQWSISLAEHLNKEVYVLREYPITKDSHGWDICDIADLYKAWYNTKAKFDEVLVTSNIVSVNEIWKEDIPDPEFIFLRKHLAYFSPKYQLMYDKSKVADVHPWISAWDLYDKMVLTHQIPQYESLCYLEGWKDWHYNLLKPWSYMTTSNEDPFLHPDIERVLLNLCNDNEENLEWLHKSILYKITHINDVYLPAVIFFWPWGSWKWSFIKLLSYIFWKDNTLVWLWQDQLWSRFSAYNWKKLIVEYKEISSWNTRDDKKITDKLKGIIWEATILVEQKSKDPVEIENIARFHFSSNHALPLQMDSKHSWNRRFTVIKTWWKISSDEARDFHTAIDNRINVSKYISRLYHTFPEVPKMKNFPALDNKDKRELEDNCESESNQFFEWFEQKYPYIVKISNIQFDILRDLYCNENWIDQFTPALRGKIFKNSLSHKYQWKMVKLWEKNTRGFYIHKTPIEKDSINDFLQKNPDKKTYLTTELGIYSN